MYIRPEFRGQGLMENLLGEVKTAARHEAAVELRLYAHCLNERALKAYRKSGFAESDYMIMTLTLKKTTSPLYDYYESRRALLQ